MKSRTVLALLGCIIAAKTTAGEATLPDAVAANLKPNLWAKVVERKTGGRSAPGLFYAPGIGRLVLFAGSPSHYGRHRRYDVEELDLAAGKWVNAYPPGRAAGRPDSGPVKIAFKQVRGKLLRLDGKALRIGEPFAAFQYAWVPPQKKLYVYLGDSMVTYDPPTRTWAYVKAAPRKGAGRWGSLVYDPVNNELMMVGGHGGSDVGTWAFDLARNEWRRLACGSHALKTLHAAAKTRQWDAVTLLGLAANRFSVAETDEEAKADLSACARTLGAALKKLANDAKTANLADAEKPAAAHAAALLDAASASATTLTAKLGGKIDAALMAELRSLEVTVERAMNALAPEPPGRAHSQAAYDPIQKKIIVFGGDGLDRAYSDTWVYDCKTRTWEQRFPKVAPPPRGGHVLVWLPGAKTMALVGGYSSRWLAQDVWTYAPAKNEWTLHALVPLRRGRHGRQSSPGTPGALCGGGYPLIGLAAADDTVIAFAPVDPNLWALKVDPSKTDPALQAKHGVEPGTLWFRGSHPAAWEKVANPDPTKGVKFIEDLPVNQWTTFDFPKYAPGARNRWGTTAYDPDRHQFLFWGGGHASSMDNEVAHFSVRAGIWTISYPPDAPIQRGSYMSWSGVTFQDRPAMPWAHAYKGYEYDPCGRMFLLNRAYDVRAREWEPKPYPGLKNGGLMRSLVEHTPHGVVCLSQHGLFRFDAKAAKWEKLPWKGPGFGRAWCDGHALLYDSKRDSLWMAHAHIFRYDFKTGTVVKLDVKRPAVLKNPLRTFALMREQAYLPDADLLLLMRVAKGPGGKPRNIAWDPNTLKYYWVDLPFVDKGKPAKGVGFSWACAIAYDPTYKVVLLNDSRSRRVWALKFDRKTAKMTEVSDQ